MRSPQKESQVQAPVKSCKGKTFAQHPGTFSARLTAGPQQSPRRWPLVTGAWLVGPFSITEAFLLMEKNLRRLIWVSLPIMFCLSLIGWRMISPAQSAQPQLVQASKPSIAVSSTSNSPTPAVAPPGTTLYVAKRGDSSPLVARHYLFQTSYLTAP